MRDRQVPPPAFPPQALSIFFERRTRGFGEIKAPRPPILRVRPPLQPPITLQAIDVAAESHIVEFQDFRERRLVDALSRSKMNQDTPLSTGQPQRLRPLVEPGSHEPRHIMQQKADIGFGVHIKHASIL